VKKDGQRYPFAAFFYGFYHLRYWFNGQPDLLHQNFEFFKKNPIGIAPVYLSKDDKNAVLDSYIF